METGTFMDIVSVHYKDIKKLFASRCYNQSTPFDEDSFNDAFIKCTKRFGNDVIDYDTVLKYYWIAYVHTMQSNMVKEEPYDSFDIMIHDRIDDDACTQAQRIYNMVMAAVSVAYGESDMLIYSLHKYHGWSVQDLIDAGFDCSDIKSKIHEIHKFVKAYCKENIAYVEKES